MQCVILTGGLATRLGPLTESLPKALVQVAGRPFIDRQLELLAGQGVTEVVLCIGHLGGPIREYVGDGTGWGLEATYVDEGEALRGTGGALRFAGEQGALAERFAVLYGDSYLPAPIGPLWSDFEQRQPIVLMAVYRNRGRFDRSNVRFSGGRVTRYDKREPDPAEAGMEYIDYGLAIIDRDRFLAWVPDRDPADLADAYRELSEAGELAGHEVDERFYEIGSPAGLAELEGLLAGGEGSTR